MQDCCWLAIRCCSIEHPILFAGSAIITGLLLWRSLVWWIERH